MTLRCPACGKDVPSMLAHKCSENDTEAAVRALQNNSYHNFAEGDARGIVEALRQLGFTFR